MAEPTNPLIAFSNAAAQVVERSASSIVAVHGGGRWPSSGIHWRSGVIVTAEEVLERDEDIKVISVISDEVRTVVEEEWPELAHKLPPKSQH
jgi:hypothetical protein